MAEDKKKEIDVTVIEVTEEYLKEKLYKIRGKRVLLDADLAEIYGYDTKGFNRQVKNNIEKFDDDFMFELTDEELEDLRYKNCTANISSKSRYNPHVFTEQVAQIEGTSLDKEKSDEHMVSLEKLSTLETFVLFSKGMPSLSVTRASY